MTLTLSARASVKLAFNSFNSNSKEESGDLICGDFPQRFAPSLCLARIWLHIILRSVAAADDDDGDYSGHGSRRRRRRRRRRRNLALRDNSFHSIVSISLLGLECHTSTLGYLGAKVG